MQARRDLAGLLAQLEEELHEIRGETTVLDRDLRGREQQVSDEKLKLARLQGDLSRLQGQYQASQELSSVQDIIAGRLLAAQQELSEEMKRLQQHQASAYHRPTEVFSLSFLDCICCGFGASVELLRRGSDYFVRTRSTSGADGLAPTKQMDLFIPIFLKAVAPVFVGRDARELEALIDEVYVRNYKMAGQPFWCPVAYVEQSLLDMLGKIAGKPVGELRSILQLDAGWLGMGLIRREVEVGTTVDVTGSPGTVVALPFNR